MKTAEPARLATEAIPRHYHSQPYATLVVEGGYVEAGDQGRFKVSAGDILLHPPYSAHRDQVDFAKTYVLDVPLPMDGRLWPGIAKVADPDLLIQMARRDLVEARDWLLANLIPISQEHDDPADLLAGALSDDPSIAIGEWAAANGYPVAWLSRRFKRHYGTDSAAFRAEARSRLAWRQIITTTESLAELAAGCGFADQAHMTRSVGRLTGAPPNAWRRSVKSVQERILSAR